MSRIESISADRCFDYVIIGGGAAGCVLASRLSEDGHNKVLLIEAGIDTPPGATPADILDPYPLSYDNPKYRWPLSGYPLTELSSRPRQLLHARVMGGGSSIMGMIMLRGLPADYDTWQNLGAAGWGWGDVLPYFRALENDLDFAGELHGKSGPTEVRRHRKEDWPPLAVAAGAYASRREMPFIADMNGEFKDGYGSLPIAGTTTQRASSATAYLTREVRSRPNLEILSESMGEELAFDGARIVGVYARRGSERMFFRAKETILAMGALLTPAFLLKQGIGDPAQLSAAGIDVRVARNGVGANLQNHASVLVFAHLRSAGVQRRPQRNHNNTMFRYSSGIDPAVRADMAIALGSRASWHAIARRIAHFSPFIMAPASRGQVSLRGSNDNELKPLVEYNLLGDSRDEARLTDGLHRLGALLAAPELSRIIGTPVGASRLAGVAKYGPKTRFNRIRTEVIGQLFDLVPGLGDWAIGSVGGPGGTLAELLTDPGRLTDFVRKNVGPLAHHAGTCRMGAAEDPAAVVDFAGRVHGVDGLRVVDASVMPTVPRANTNLPVLMIAEKISDHIRGRNPVVAGSA